MPTYSGSFDQFLTDRGIGDPAVQTPYNAAQIRQRAQAIAGLQSMADPAFASYVTDPTTFAGQGAYGTALGGLTTPELASYRSDYYTGQGAGDNTRQLVNLMALQRPDIGTQSGGQYGGAMQQAIGSLVNELYSQYAVGNPGAEANFLDWWLQRTGSGGRLSPTYNPQA